MRMKTHNLMAGALVFLALGVAFDTRLSNALAQGSLNPPGAPAPLMKSLDQIEARTPVDPAHMPGDANYLILISQPGSYYLTTNIVGVSSKNGIGINAQDVVLDLNGFALMGTNTARSGIVIPSAQTNITVRNGVIRGWGINYNAIESSARNVRFERLSISGNTAGISASTGTVITDCIVSDSSLFGVYITGSGCVVRNNIFVRNNILNVGGDIASIVVLGARNRIEGNHVSESGPGGFGIRVSNTAGYTNNLIIQNSVAGGGPNNYSFNTNQFVGPLVTNTVSGIITNLHPWANFSF